MLSFDRVRRQLLTTLGAGAGLWAAAGIAGSAGAGAPVASRRGDRIELTVDVACLGHTQYENEDGATNRDPDYINAVPGKMQQGFRRSDLRGSSFYYEGLIYAGGTIPTPMHPEDVVWNFEKPPLGTYFDRGWVTINHRSDGPFVPRPSPHLLSHSDFYLGGIVGPENLTPTDMLAIVGLQHDDGAKGRYLRSVLGGTGRYKTACGEVWQTPLGCNSSLMRGRFLPEGVKVPTENFRFAFELYL